MVTLTDIQNAELAIRELLEPSPVTHSPALSELCGKDIFLKWDSKLPTGSFKERGAINFLSRLGKKGRQKGVCASSLGNHALALSRNSARLSIPCTIVMPGLAPVVKVSRTEKYGAKVILHGETFDEARQYAIDYAKEHKLTLVPPFDHVDVIAGQGTSALELTRQLEDFDCVIVPVGGGGYISGISTALRALRPKVKIFGVQSKWTVDYRSGKQSGDPRAIRNRIHPPTIADGIAVKGMGDLTKPIMDQCVDQFIVVDENQIASALIKFVELERAIIEGAAAAALAAVLHGDFPKDLRRIVLFVCGSNIDIDLLSRLINRDLWQRGRLIRLRVDLPDKPGSLAIVTKTVSEANANIVHVGHDRTAASYPGDVNLTLVLEVRDAKHTKHVCESLEAAGLPVMLVP